MQALVYDRAGRATLRDVPFTPIAGECTVRVLRAGICGTDLQLLDGYADFAGIPGHEFVGVVHSVAQDEDAHWAGKRVAAEINVGCGECTECRAGVKEHCPARTVLGIRGRPGAFAELVSVPASNLHAVPDSLSDDAAVFVEPVAAACRIPEQVALSDRRVAVLGDGRMGLVVAQVLRTVTSEVTVFGRHDHKLAVARSLGLTAERVPNGSSSQRFDVVVDVTGRAEGLQRAIELTRPRGTVVMKTTTHGAAPFTAWPVVVNEVTLVGSRCGPFAPAIALLARGAVRVEPLLTATFSLSQHAQAFETARTGLKVVFNLAAVG